MSNNELKIILQLKDHATKQLKKFQVASKNAIESMKKNWLALAAGIVAASLAIKKAFDLINQGAKVKQQREAFDNLARSVNTNADDMIRKLKELSGETISSAQAMENASKAIILGLGSDQIPRMMEISRAAARAFGTDVNFMFESIVLGSARQSRLILDNLGVVIKMEEANRKFADSIDKTVNSLTEEEKKMAFLNEVMAQGENIIKSVGIEGQTQAEAILELGARWKDFTDQIAVFVSNSNVVKGIIAVLTDAISVWTDVLRANTAEEEIAAGSLADVRDRLIEVNDAIEEELALRELRNAFFVAGDDSKLNFLLARQVELREELNRLQGEAIDLGIIVVEASKKEIKVTDEHKKQVEELKKQYLALADSISKNLTSALSDMLSGTKSVKEAFADLGRAMIKTITDFLAEQIIAATIGKLLQTAATAASVAQAATIAAAWAPAAAFVSLATFGSNAIAAATGIGSVTALTTALSIPKPVAMAEGGVVTRPTLALIGEAGPEAVVPLGASGGMRNINIEVNISEPQVRSLDDIFTLSEEVSDQIAKEIERI